MRDKDNPLERDGKSMMDFIFFVFEDIPELFISTINTITLGRTLSVVQILSPIATAISMMTKGGNRFSKGVMSCYAATFAILPMYIYIVCNFTLFKECPEEVCGDVYSSN